MLIRLYTADNGFVVASDIPEFKPPFEVVMWGSRFFKYDGFAGDTHRYIEVKVYCITDSLPQGR